MSSSPRKDPFAKPAYDGDRLMFASEIAKEAQVSGQCIYKWWRQGTLPYAQVGGRRASWRSDFLTMTQPRRNSAV